MSVLDDSIESEPKEHKLKFREQIKLLWNIEGWRGWKRRLVRGFIYLTGLFLLTSYFTGPWMHWFWFGLFYVNTGFWIYCILAGIFVWFIGRRNDSGIWKIKTMRYVARGEEPSYYLDVRNWLKPVIWAVSLFVFGVLFFSIFVSQEARAELAARTQVTTLDVLPNTTKGRYLPLQVAQTCAQNRLSNSQEQLGDIDPIDYSGKLNWVAPLEPHGFWNSLFNRTRGIAVITPGEAGCVLEEKAVPDGFKYGEGMIVTDELEKQLRHDEYWADIPEIFYVIGNDGQILAVAPYISYDLHFPWMSQIPKWGGVFIVHPDGVKENLTPDQAQKDERLAGQRIYPEKLARLIGEDWQYRNGLSNNWFTHKDQADLPEIEGSLNQMPFLVPTATGPVWTLTFKPHGPTEGVFEIMTIDAHTGHVSVFKPPASANYIGVNRGDESVRNTFPNNVWFNGTSGNNVAIEPRLVVKGGTLYWQHTVTNTTYGQVQATTLTNAVTGTVVVVCSPDELDKFLAGTFAGHGTLLCAPQDPGSVVPTPGQPSQPQPVPSGPQAPGVDLRGLNDQQLSDLLRRIADEQDKRRQPTG